MGNHQKMSKYFLIHVGLYTTVLNKNRHVKWTLHDGFEQKPSKVLTLAKFALSLFDDGVNHHGILLAVVVSQNIPRRWITQRLDNRHVNYT